MAPPSALDSRDAPALDAAGGSGLWDAIAHSGADSIAVMGTAKNTGKTVTLNHLLAQAARAGMAVGVTSIGRDGESRDEVYAIPKPPVRLWPGNVVATARATLHKADLQWEPIEDTGLSSAMGEIVLVRVRSSGTMEVAGPTRSAEQLAVIGRMRALGMDKVLLDGALGRSQHASPAVARAVVLATGAALGGSMADVLRKTRERLALLQIPPIDEERAARCAAVFEQGGIGVWSADGRALLREPGASLTAASRLAACLAREPALVALSGAVGSAVLETLQAMARRRPGLTLVVNDGTRLFVEAADLAHFVSGGGRVAAWRKIHIAGLTLNPSAPFLPPYDAREFLRSARAAFPGLDVRDVLLAASTRVRPTEEPDRGPTAA